MIILSHLAIQALTLLVFYRFLSLLFAFRLLLLCAFRNNKQIALYICIRFFGTINRCIHMHSKLAFSFRTNISHNNVIHTCMYESV
jgi:hypothetical protein